MRQPLPSALPCSHPSTLMRLFSAALYAAPELHKMATAAVAGRSGCEVLASPKPVKDIKRCMQKAQEEYGGDYTRLLDFARISILCELMTDVKDVLEC